MLEMFGVIVARRGTGPDAGSIVAASAERGLQKALLLHAGLLRIPAADLAEVRVLLDEQAATTAAQRAEAGLIARLHEIIDGKRVAQTIGELSAADAEFHVELALASGNALLPALMEALCETMRRLQAEAFERLPDWQAERDLLAVEHDAILASVESGDSAAAGIAMRDHVMRSYRRVMDPPRAPAWPR